jgi:hypothetical protein
MVKFRSYLGSGGEGIGPSTPWGAAQAGYQLARGVMLYSTAGHGGIRVTRKWAKDNLSGAAINLADTQGGYLWFEEDCQINLVLFEHPELWTKLFTTQNKDPEEIRETARKSIAAYYPVYFYDEFRELCDRYGLCPAAKELKPHQLIALSQFNGNAVVYKVRRVSRRDPHKLVVEHYDSGSIFRVNDYTLQSRLVAVVNPVTVVWLRPSPKVFGDQMRREMQHNGVGLAP